MSAHVPHRVLLTGARGFLAAATAQALRARGTEVVGVDLVADPDHAIVAGDITAPGAWAQTLAGCDVVIHTAAVVSNAVDADEQWRINVLGTQRVLEAAAAAGVRRFVHVSSVRAFSDVGFPDGVSESHPVRADGNAYVDTKIAGEHAALALHAHSAMDVVIVRPADIYGAASRPWILEPIELMRRRQFVLPAMGRGIHSPVYVDDVVQGLILAACHQAAPGQIFTLAGPSACTTREYFGHVAAMAGLPKPLLVPTPVALGLAAVNDRAGRLRGRRTEANPETVRYLTRTGTYSTQKARDVLGYDPKTDLAAGMRKVGDQLYGPAPEVGHDRGEAAATVTD